MTRRLLAMAASAVLGATLGCDAGLSSLDAPGALDEGRDDTGADAGGGGGGGGVDIDPDTEQQLLTDPTASLNYVFIANTSRGTIARVAISGDAILIDTARVGALPTEVATVPGADTAVVLNRGSDTVSVVRAGAIGEELDVTSVDVVVGANQLAISPDGAWAFVWYDNRRAEAGDITGPLSEVSAVRLAEGDEVAWQISVGINVRDVVFDDAAATAFVITDDGVSPVPLDGLRGDEFVPPIDVDGDPLVTAVGGDREVLVTDDGSLAVVRDGTQPLLRFVALDTGEVTEFALDGAPSDVDLVPGTSDVLVTVRETGVVELVDVEAWRAGSPDATRTFTDFPHPVGRTVLSADGDTAVVFSGASDTGEAPFVSILSLDDDGLRSWNVRKTVAAAVVSPALTHALLVHTKEPGDPVAGAPEDEIIARSFAYTAFSLGSGLTKLVRVDARPGEIAFTDDGRHAFVLVADEARAVQEVSWIDLDTFQTRTLDFDRLPEHVGAVPGAGYVYVSQVHTLGRIAFIDVATGDVREITGFELNGLIE